MKVHHRKSRNCYYVRVKDEYGVWHDLKGGLREEDAYRVGLAYENDVALIKRGLTTRKKLQASDSSHLLISDTIEEYRAYLEYRQFTKKYIREALRCVNTVITGTKVKCLADIQPGVVGSWLAGVVKRGKSARTHNGYLRAVRTMINWACSRGMVLANSLAPLKQLPEHTDRRETSRALTFEEFDRLIRLTPNDMRQLYYLFSGRCGLRWSEIKRLQWGDLDLVKGLIHLRPEATKSRRADTLDMPSDLLGRLRMIGKGKGSIFSTSPIMRTFKADLMRAGIAYEVDGKQADRKCLRKTFCTHLALLGVDIWKAAKMMRHTDPKLTIRLYTELGMLNTQDAAERLVSASLSVADVG